MNRGNKHQKPSLRSIFFFFLAWSGFTVRRKLLLKFGDLCECSYGLPQTSARYFTPSRIGTVRLHVWVLSNPANPISILPQLLRSSPQIISKHFTTTDTHFNMTSFRVPRLHNLAKCHNRLFQPQQRRWAQVHDVRFLATHRNPDQILDRYKHKLDQKAKQ